MIVVSLILMCIPGGQIFGMTCAEFGFGMFVAGAACAVSSYLIGGVISGHANMAHGGDFWIGFQRGAVDRIVNGFTTGALIFCATKAIGAIINAVNRISILEPDSIRFSQSSVNDVQPIIDSMTTNGWKGRPIDVVRMQDGGLTAIDNSRLLAAKITRTPVKAYIHSFNDTIPFARARGIAKGIAPIPTTWGEALSRRICMQNVIYRNTYPLGSIIIGWNGL